MKSIELVRSMQASLSPVSYFEPFESPEKYIYKMTDGKNIVAAKIFKEDDGYTMPRPYRVRREIEATQALKRTPLGMYIPEYLYSLVDQQDKLSGIAVRWEDGTALDKIEGVHPLTQREFDQFEGAILATIDMGYIPFVDIIASNNVMFNPIRSPRLWIAECELETECFNMGVDNYIYFYEDSLDEVREYIGK